MESLQTKTAQGLLKKQEAFLQTLAPSLRDEVKSQLGCLSNIDEHSKAILFGKNDDEEHLINQVLTSYDDMETEENFVFLTDVTVQPAVAQLLNVDPNLVFMSALLDYKNSTLNLHRSVTVGNISELYTDLMDAKMSEEEYSIEIEETKDVEDKGQELYTLTYTVPILLLVGTRVRKDYEGA
jgi:hypothetical protein